MEKISFLSDNQCIKGTLVKPKDLQHQNPGVIFFHGMTSSEKNYIPIAQQLADNGIVGMTLSIRGHGASEGNFETLTVNDAIADGLNAYDFFTQYDFIDKKRIGLCGASVGATIASMVSAQRPIKSLVLRVPATYTRQMMRMTFRQIMAQEGEIFQKISNISDTPALRAIRQFRGSLLIITSENDQVIPIAIPRAYFAEATQAEKREMFQIKEATHNLSDKNWRQQFVNKTIKWFIENLLII